MALKFIAVVGWALLLPRWASGQSLTLDVTQAAGYSTEEVGALGTQARALAETASGLRFSIEAAWAARSDTSSDVFGAAYPYANRLQVIEAFAERTFLPDGRLFSVRAGRFRTPFGISSGSDHDWGFMRPLIRYDRYYALSNNFLGTEWTSWPASRLSVELSAGVPADVGNAVRRSAMDLVVRGQGAYSDAVVGASYIRTNPYQPASYAAGRMEFGGVDVRWMHAGIQVRGEWLAETLRRHDDARRLCGRHRPPPAHGCRHRPASCRASRLRSRPPLALHASVFCGVEHTALRAPVGSGRPRPSASRRQRQPFHGTRPGRHVFPSAPLTAMPSSSATPRSLPWHRRMEAHVVLGVSLLVAFSLGAVLVATSRAVTNESRGRASADLEAGRAAFESAF